MKNIVVDLDGTILEWPEGGWQGWKVFGEPVKEMVDVLKKIKNAGKYRIVIHTCRINEDVCGKHSINQSAYFISEYLNTHDIPFDEIWTGIGKPLGMLYIDDRACQPEQAQYLVDNLHDNT